MPDDQARDGHGDEPSLLREAEGGVLTLTINRPKRGNALDATTTRSLIETTTALQADPGEVRAVLLRGNGRHFCTGADIGGGGASADDAGRPAVGHMLRALEAGPHRLVETLWGLAIPVVVELTGLTSGMGLHVALAADLTVAAETATFSEPFADRGFNVDSGGSWLLPRFVGLTRAKRLLYTADVIDAATALEWGLIAEVVPDSDVEARAAAVAADLAVRPTFALGSMKRLLHDATTSTLPSALDAEASAVELAIRSRDFKEGMRAFMEKRDPDFSGR